MALEKMGDQFRGLPMGDLIGAPLMAACDAQVRLANATADFIQHVGFTAADADGKTEVRTVSFKFNRPAPGTTAGADGTQPTELVELDVPLLSIVKIPALSITKVDVTFDMEVKNSEQYKETDDKQAALEAEGGGQIGPFSLKVKVSGSIAQHKEHTRSSDQTAKYHVEVHAVDDGMPEGLARVLDIMAQSVAPKKVAPPANSNGTQEQKAA